MRINHFQFGLYYFALQNVLNIFFFPKHVDIALTSPFVCVWGCGRLGVCLGLGVCEGVWEFVNTLYLQTRT